MKKHFAVGLLAIILLLSTSREGVAAIPETGTLSGRVTDGSGIGVAGAQVVISSTFGATSNSNGYYSRSGVTAGTYYVIVRAPSASYANAYAPSVTINDGASVTQNFVLSLSVGYLAGRVYDADTNAPLANVALLAQGAQELGNSGWSNATSASDGTYILPNLAPGHYYVGPVPVPPGYTGATLQPNISPGSNTLDIGLHRAGSSFVGRITTAGGTPISGANIFVGSPTDPNSSCFVQTNTNGDYTCLINPGRYLIHLVDAVYPGQITQYTIASNQHIRINFIATYGSQTINGFIHDYNSNPINYAFIEADQQGGAGYYRTIRTSNDGAYNLTGLGNQGNYQFHVAADGYTGILNDQVPILTNPWTRNFKLGVFNDVLAQDVDSRIEFPFYYVEFMRDRNIIAGFTDPSQCPSNKAPCFLPNNNVRRGEYSKMLVLAKGWPTNNAGGPHFTDVPTSNIFYNTIETAYNNGAISGYTAAQCGGDACFRPNGAITRAEATKLAVAASSWTLLSPATASYADVPASYWAYRYIETARTNGANANDDPSFRPGSFITRGETAKLVCVANANGCGQ